MQALVVADDAVTQDVAEGALAGRGYRVVARAATMGDAVACRRGDDDAFAVLLLDADAVACGTAPAAPTGSSSCARRAEAALRASEERLRPALEGAAMGTWGWEVGAGQVRWSDRTGPLNGLPRGTPSISSEAFFDLVHPDDRAAVREADRRHVVGGGECAAQFRVVWPDGTIRWLEGKGRATVRDAHGHATQISGVTTNIAARKEAEEAPRGSERRHRALCCARRTWRSTGRRRRGGERTPSSTAE